MQKEAAAPGKGLYRARFASFSRKSWGFGIDSAGEGLLLEHGWR